jgi:hypothetical protein
MTTVVIGREFLHVETRMGLSSTFAVLHGMKLADKSFSPPAGVAIYAAGARA